MIHVYNLAAAEKDAKYSFSEGVTAVDAVCYAFADNKNLLSMLFSVRETGQSLSEVFPVIYGKHSVSCGDYVAEYIDDLES